MAKNDLQGALDLLILKTLSQLGAMHGYGIVTHIRRVSDERIIVEEGSLYPALHRMEQNEWVRARWLWLCCGVLWHLAGVPSSIARSKPNCASTCRCASTTALPPE